MHFAPDPPRPAGALRKRAPPTCYRRPLMTRPQFPPVASSADYERIRHDDALFDPGVVALCETLGLSKLIIARFPGGSLPVYALDDSLVLKLYPPHERVERNKEAAVLRSIEARLPIPTPGVRAVGDWDDWGYLLMDRLRGQSLDEVWPALSSRDRLGLAEELGAALAVLHAVRGPSPDGVRIRWQHFLDEQRRTAMARQRARGLDARWLEQIPAFLDGVFSDANQAALLAAGSDSKPPEALLHTEIMAQHLLVERGPAGYRLSGLFDFQDAMIGAPEYEFVAAGLFVSCGVPGVLRRMLLAYGYAEVQLDGALEERLMALCLLHRYSNLAWYLKRLPPPIGACSLRELAGFWWGTA